MASPALKVHKSLYGGLSEAGEFPVSWASPRNCGQQVALLDWGNTGFAAVSKINPKINNLFKSIISDALNVKCSFKCKMVKCKMVKY